MSFQGCVRSPRAPPPRRAPSSVSHEPHYPPLPHKFLFSHAGQSLSSLSMITTALANVYSRIPSYLSRHGCRLFSLCAYAKDVLSVVSLVPTCFSLWLLLLLPFCVFFLSRLPLAARPFHAAPGSPSLLHHLALSRHLRPFLADFSMTYFLLYAPLLFP